MPYLAVPQHLAHALLVLYCTSNINVSFLQPDECILTGWDQCDAHRTVGNTAATDIAKTLVDSV